MAYIVRDIFLCCVLLPENPRACRERYRSCTRPFLCRLFALVVQGILIECMEVQAPAMLGIKCPLAVNMLVGMSWGNMRKVVSNDAKA